MNSRDREYCRRLLTAWGFWARSGRTFQNVLGFPMRSVEYSIMRGDTGGKRPRHSKVPHKFTIDKQIETADRVIIGLPESTQAPVAGYFIKGMAERDLTVCLDCSRRQIRKHLYSAYQSVLNAL